MSKPLKAPISADASTSRPNTTRPTSLVPPTCTGGSSDISDCITGVTRSGFRIALKQLPNCRIERQRQRLKTYRGLTRMNTDQTVCIRIPSPRGDHAKEESRKEDGGKESCREKGRAATGRREG